MVIRTPFMVQLKKISNSLMVTSLPTHGTVLKKFWKTVKSGQPQLKMTNVHCWLFGGQARLSKPATSTTWKKKGWEQTKPLHHIVHKHRWIKQPLKCKNVSKNVLRVKGTRIGCVRQSKISWRLNQVGTQQLRILITMTTCKVVPFFTTTIAVQVMLIQTIASWTVHRRNKMVHVATLKIIHQVVSNSS